jgi:methionyl-tRNA formyltransferase
LLDGGHIVRLVVTQPDKPAGRGRRLTPSAVKAFAVERGIPVIGPPRIRTDGTVLERVREACPDVNVVVAYGQIIPHAVHYFPRYHSLNLHFSLLPEYRGAAPVQWAVLSGDAETGVTIIELDDRMDEGDILTQERVAVELRETASALEARLAERGADLLVSTLARIDDLPHIKQDDARATHAPKIRKEDGRISWSDPAVVIDRKVLALADKPGVFSHVGSKRVNVLRGHPVEPAEAPAGAGAAPPGTIVWISRVGLEVACGGGTAYVVEELRPEGKGVMPAHAFSLGTKIARGDLMG